MAYLQLLRSIRDDSLADIGDFCEKGLYRAIQEGMEDINREAERIELLNEDRFPRNIHIRVIDFNQTFGASIDREENKTKRI